MTDQWRTWVPVLRVADAAASARFYCDILGFQKDWEHRFADDFPLYVSVSRDNLTLHLSEHEGGGTGHANLYVSVANVDATHAQLVERGFEPDNPPENREYGVRDFCITDPDGHLFTLGTDLEEFEKAPGRKYDEE